MCMRAENFHGTAGYYRQYVLNFSSLASPLNHLTSLSTSFVDTFAAVSLLHAYAVTSLAKFLLHNRGRVLKELLKHLPADKSYIKKLKVNQETQHYGSFYLTAGVGYDLSDTLCSVSPAHRVPSPPTAYYRREEVQVPG
ncbi:hypothetical protein EB796_007453 [Bugula neritina]|uniref:Uncharacterized protein n=1 Tax=Bugula neritina TaxID=10212 RepID=A0A7J7K9F5_BUGNE|nr:hypothetical protein EB796_007453 [Bugula neritina]